MDRVVRIRAFPPRVTVSAIQTYNDNSDDIPRLSVSVDYPREFGSNHRTSRNYSDTYPYPGYSNRLVEVAGVAIA